MKLEYIFQHVLIEPNQLVLFLLIEFFWIILFQSKKCWRERFFKFFSLMFPCVKLLSCEYSGSDLEVNVLLQKKKKISRNVQSFQVHIASKKLNFLFKCSWQLYSRSICTLNVASKTTRKKTSISQWTKYCQRKTHKSTSNTILAEGFVLYNTLHILQHIAYIYSIVFVHIVNNTRFNLLI